MQEKLKNMRLNDNELDRIFGGTQQTTVQDDGKGTVWCNKCHHVLTYNGHDDNCHRWTCPECGEYYYKSKYTNLFWQGFIKEREIKTYMLKK